MAQLIMNRTIRRAAALVTGLVASLVVLQAGAEERLNVYIKPIEPFVFEQNGQPVGYSIDLWERIAKETNLEYHFVRVKTVTDMLDALKSGEADVAVGALSITAEREEAIDFTHPFYESGLQIMVGPQRTTSMWGLVKGFMTPQLLRLVGVLLLALFGTSHILWLLERRRNPESFPPRYGHGISESIWWSISILISGGCENKTPIGNAGRLVAIIWMLAGILLVSYITASVTSAMTVSSLTGDIGGPGDLPGHRVATVKGTTAEKYLGERRVDLRAAKNIDQAYYFLNKGEVDAVVFDAPMLQYHTTQPGGSQDRVVGRLFQRQNYGLGLQQGSKYRKPINEAMLRLKENGFFDELQKKWFGESDD